MMSPMVMTPGRSRLGPPRRVTRNSPGSKVRVVVRVRPFLPLEFSPLAGKRHSCIEVCKDKDGVGEDTLYIKDVKIGRRESYKLDSCYGENDDIDRIFSMELEPLLPMLFSGCNATVFAYGATGSGKTHTMQGLEEEPGLMPLALMSIFSLSKTTKSTVEVSYYEVYMDRCYDLLEPKAGEVSVLEDSNGCTQLRGLTQVKVQSIEEFHDIFAKGCANRKIGQTGLNDASSRSHGVLRVTVTTGPADSENSQVGKLNLIDLAGNEDNRRTGNEGVRLAESSRINQSLFALSNVINALNANEVRVPYRDSKLTRILQDSLGGTSSALMIACLNPGSYQEGIQTLSLAARSKLIVNRTDQAKEHDTPTNGGKVDMQAKLRAWREANGRTPGKTSPKCFSPLRSKAQFILSPSRFHPINHQVSHRKMLAEQQLSAHINKISSFSAEAPSYRSKTECSQSLQKKLDGIVKDERRHLEGSKPDADSSLTNSITVRQDALVYENIDEKENKVVRFDTPIERDLRSVASPPLSEKLRCLGSALREALSPRSSNAFILRNSDASPKSYNTPSKCRAIFRTPDTQHDSPCAWTPLEKFNTSSRDCQDILVKDYIDILNTGSREQLLQLKGIGERRADYILKLRETSETPINELRDLEKIGVSARQAHGIFNSNVVRQISSTPI
ncbi:hypothetical protein O6H91_23G045800 [Diphasiastrum complanatum]|uniref:Uncharacterized protein n=1 Tax=Diphasiastrum complanatum TaxID=34168 RepID=A0ACC2AC76_DIPCM|nr:hypothetical protein O6H91_23G045800 [Diphasiastrum complanatum]